MTRCIGFDLQTSSRPFFTPEPLLVDPETSPLSFFTSFLALYWLTAGGETLLACAPYKACASQATPKRGVTWQLYCPAAAAAAADERQYRALDGYRELKPFEPCTDAIKKERKEREM
jgi:hypothetical protein